MTDGSVAAALRASPVAGAIRRERLIVVLRRVAPQSRLIALVEELADAGARIFEITFDAPDAAEDLVACRASLGGEFLFGAGTIRSPDALEAAVVAGAEFAVSPLLDTAIPADALVGGIPFIPGALSPTEIDAAWRVGSTSGTVFPAPAVGLG